MYVVKLASKSSKSFQMLSVLRARRCTDDVQKMYFRDIGDKKNMIRMDAFIHLLFITKIKKIQVQYLSIPYRVSVIMSNLRN